MDPSPTPREFVYAIHRSYQNGLFIRTEYIRALGLLGAAFLEQLITLDMLFNKDPRQAEEDTGGWFYRTQEQIEERTGLSEKQQTRLIQELKDARILRVHKVGLPAKNHYQIRYERLQQYLLEQSPPIRPNGGTSAAQTAALVTPERGHYIGSPKGLYKVDPLGGALAPSLDKASKSKAKAKERDPRLDHPAIQAVQEIAGLLPPKPKGAKADVWTQVIAALGEAPDLTLLQQCREAWLAKGFNPMNWAWALDWYPKGGPPASPGRKPEGKTSLYHNEDPAWKTQMAESVRRRTIILGDDE